MKSLKINNYKNMNIMKLKYFSMLLLLFSLVACDQLIEEEIFSEFSAENFLKNEEELTAQTLGLYRVDNQVKYAESFEKLVLSVSNIYTTRIVGNASFGAYQTSSASSEYSAVWQESYQLIARANTIIKNAPNAPIDIVKINEFVAEAKFNRAYHYFHLTRLFGELPLYSTRVESADKEVLYPSRSSVEDVYKLIIEDLIYAKDNLPMKSWGNDSPPGRVKAAAAYNLLGLVYLTQSGLPLQNTEGYNNAISTIEEMLLLKSDLGVDLLPNWYDNFSRGENSEKLYSMSAVIGGDKNSMGKINNGSGSFYGFQTSYNHALTYEFYDLFHEDDVRQKDGLFYSYKYDNGAVVTYNPAAEIDAKNKTASYRGRNGISMAKYVDSLATGGGSHECDVMYMRFAESYLILAEAYCEINELDNARQYLQIVRDRAGLSAVPVTETDQEALRQIIRQERWFELFGENTEVYDIRRWGTTKGNFDTHVAVDRWIPDAVWRDGYVLYPIPSRELTTNPNMTQNDDW
tara:strand:- start:14037 stop:15590 length:1554 start_codon:yes stop_codon:yes gene_type:complete